MTALLDTHFLIWITLGSRRLKRFPWLERYRPWSVSPISLLEVQYLSEVGRLEVSNPEFSDMVTADDRFLIDDAPLLGLVRQALRLGWTRDPFDRLLVAHSMARRLPLLTTDETIRRHHALLVAEDF